MKIYAVDEDEISTDITEGVQALYDLVISSMDYRSGFWSYEDAAPVAKLAALLGWDGADGLQKYADDELHKTEQAAYIKDNALDNLPQYYTREDIPRPDGSVIVRHKQVVHEHEHVFSTPGRCMWPQCKETEKR